MPPLYVKPHWETFANIPFQKQGATGTIPAKWARSFHLDISEKLPSQQLDRAQVRAVCVDPDKDVLFGYACAMAWVDREVSTSGTSRHRGTIVSSWQIISDGFVREH
jgi:hypothetical protein